MARLTTEKKASIIGALVEGTSIRSTERMTGVHRDTIMRLILQVGHACERLMAEEIRHVRCEQLELDEIWCFVRKKKANLKPSDDPERVGDQWCWMATDPDSKLVPHHLIGLRDARDAIRFTRELARRVDGHVQINADKLNAYRQAVYAAWGRNVDFARIVKRFAGHPLDTGRYSPPKVVGVQKEIVYGTPDIDRICTSHAERNNLTVTMQMRRFTRLTNGFSKKVENLEAAANLHFAHYNFCRKHSTIRTTPALAAGVADRQWTIEELVELPY